MWDTKISYDVWEKIVENSCSFFVILYSVVLFNKSDSFIRNNFIR